MNDWETFWHNYKNAKQSQRLSGLLGTLGETVRENKTLCPAHNDTTPSLEIYADHVHCFVCGFHGDLQDYLQKKGYNERAALEEAARLYGIEAPPEQGQAPVTSKSSGSVSANSDYTNRSPSNQRAPSWLPDVVEAAQAALEAKATPEAKAVWEYLKSRKLHTVATSLRFGVVDSTVESSQAGTALDKLRGRLLIPTLAEDGTPVFVNARTVQADVEPKYLKPAGLASIAPYGAQTLKNAPQKGRILVTEGELDGGSLHALLGLQEAILGLSGGVLPREGFWDQKIAALNVPVYVFADSDNAGEKKAAELRTRLRAAGAKAYVVNLPGHADVNAALCNLGQEEATSLLEGLLANAAHAETADAQYIQSAFLSELDRRLKTTNMQYTTGLPELDKLLDGGYAEGLHLLGGLTGTGKTSFAVHMTIENALQGRHVLLTTFEQSRYELWARITAALTNVPYAAIKRGYFVQGEHERPTSELLQADEGWQKVLQVARHVRIVEGGGDALSGDDGTQTLEVLQADAEAIRDEHGDAPLIIVDYVQRMPAPKHIREVQERVSHNAGSLQRNLSRSVGSPVLALSSVNRRSYNLGAMDMEDRLSAFKAAGELEYTSYTSLLLYGLPEAKQGVRMRPGMTSTWKPMVLDLVKNREGRTGRVACKWTAKGDAWDSDMPYGSDGEAL